MPKIQHRRGDRETITLYLVSAEIGIFSFSLTPIWLKFGGVVTNTLKNVLYYYYELVYSRTSLRELFLNSAGVRREKRWMRCVRTSNLSRLSIVSIPIDLLSNELDWIVNEVLIQENAFSRLEFYLQMSNIR